MERLPEPALELRRLAAPDTAIALVAIVGCFSLWSANDGGYEEIVWYPVGLVLLVLTGILAWSSGRRRLGRFTATALYGLGGYTVWAYLSIAWAGDRGLALTGANRTLVYLIAFYAAVSRSWRGADAMVLAAAWALVTLIVGVVALVHANGLAHPELDFVGGRMTVPIDYPNANAALFVLAAWPFVAAAQELRLPPWLRALALGCATASAAIALLAQSKGAALGVAATIIVVAAIARARARLLVQLAVVGVTIAIFHGPLFAVYNRINAGGDARHTVHHAVVAVALSFVVASALGAVIALIGDRMLRTRPVQLQRAGRVFVTGAALCAVLALAAVTVHYGGPASTVRDGWHAFIRPEGSDSSHFVSTAGNHRYDFWRVAARQFKRSPLLGAGIDNFGADYVRYRHSLEQPLYPHSLEARLLGETGLVGFILFVVFSVAAGWLAVCAVRARSLLAPVGLASATMFFYWLAHGSVDWLWEFPGLSGPVFVLLGCTASVEPPPVVATERSRWTRFNSSTVHIAAGIAAAVLLVPSWLAARDVASALSSWRRDPAGASSLLHDATRLNPVSDEADVVAGTIDERRRDWPAVQQAFQRALERNEQNWYSHLELGIALAKQGNKAGAIATLLRAHTLDPRESLVTDVLSSVRADRPIDVTRLDERIIGRTTVSAAS
ncbi:MAG TPA: O-antigen ligase family protein [Gaiellaceae bacterium]|nr:O-antigen ligase family protein [Gaiellaceae bacterium]